VKVYPFKTQPGAQNDPRFGQGGRGHLAGMGAPDLFQQVLVPLFPKEDGQEGGGVQYHQYPSLP
jgi:hypothetical protein